MAQVSVSTEIRERQSQKGQRHNLRSNSFTYLGKTLQVF